MTPIEAAEQVLLDLERPDTFDVGVASGFRLAKVVVQRWEVYTRARDFFAANASLLAPMALDRLVKYAQIDPAPYEHPHDTTAFALLLLVEEVHGDSPELKAVMAAAELLRSPWWTRHFLVRKRSLSQSGA